jgi:hypothetical protein
MTQVVEFSAAETDLNRRIRTIYETVTHLTDSRPEEILNQTQDTLVYLTD